MGKQALIIQPSGLGDCIFAQGVAHSFIDKGYEAIWPVRKAFVEGLRRAYPRVAWMADSFFRQEIFNIKQDCEIEGTRIIPLRWSDSLLGMPARFWMRSKYDYYGLDYRTWKIHAKYERDHLRERVLAEQFGITPGMRFSLISAMYMSDVSRTVEMDISNSLKTVNIQIIPGYSLFDYSWLIENAETIHAVNSAIFYLLELLDLQAKEAHIYARTPDEQGFPYTDYLQTKNYLLHP